MFSPTRHIMPLSSPLLLLNRCPRCLHIRRDPSRPSSTTLPDKAAAVTSQSRKVSISRIPARKSRKVEMKKASISKMSDDIGLLPETFVRPPNRDMPRLFSREWKLRLKVEMLWLRTRAQNLGSLIYFLYWSQRKMPKSQKMPFNIQARPAIALDLHRRFYTLLASGDLPSLRPIICSGLTGKARAQITYREESQLPPQSWKVIRYTSTIRPPFSSSLVPWPLSSLLPGTHAKILADRVVPVPAPKSVYLRQCVVRIRSLQELDKRDGKPPQQSDVTEYLAMQQMKVEGQETVWKVWGTTRATTKEEMRKLVGEGAARSEQRFTLMDRLRAASATRGL